MAELPSAGGGGGAVASVNGHTGVVVLAASDVGADAAGAAAAAAAASDPSGAAATAASGAAAALATHKTSTDHDAHNDGRYDALGAASTAAAAAQAASQPLDSDLTAIAALSTTTFGRGVLALADAAALRTAAGVVIGTDVQAHDSDLDAIAALSTTTFGRSLLALADAAALRTSAGLGSLATKSAVASADITDGTIVDGDISSSAAIAESKLSLATDAAAGTGSRRTLGTGAAQAAAGNDSRLSDARTPTAHASTHAAAGSDALALSPGQITAMVVRDTLANIRLVTPSAANNGTIYAATDCPGAAWESTGSALKQIGFGPGLALGVPVTTGKVWMSSMGMPPMGANGAVPTIGAANRGKCIVMTVPADGTITGLVWYIQGASGNYDAVIYQPGTPNWTTLWHLGSTACPAAPNWTAKIAVTPAVAVLTGQQIACGLAFDNNTATLGTLNGQAGQYAGPAAFWTPAPGSVAPFAIFKDTVFPWPSTLTDSGLSQIGSPPHLFLELTLS